MTVLSVLAGLLFTVVSIHPMPARAGATYSASIEPSVLRYPSTRGLTYRVNVTSDAAGAKLSIHPDQPRFVFRRSEGFPPTSIWGSPVIAAGPPVYSGPGTFRVSPEGPTIVDFAGLPEATPGVFRTYPSLCGRGYYPLASDFYAGVTLPPSSTGTVSFPYRTGRAPPWRPADYRMQFQIQAITSDPLVEPPFSGPPELQAPPIPLGRGRGVFIKTTIAHHADLADGHVAVTVRATTRPALRREEIGIRAGQRQSPPYRLSYRKGRSLEPVAEVTTDRHGRFETVLVANPDTYYTVAAYYRSDTRRLANDRSCPLFFYSG